MESIFDHRYEVEFCKTYGILPDKVVDRSIFKEGKQLLNPGGC